MQLFDYRGHKALKFNSVSGDWGATYLYKGQTKSGNLKVSEILSEGPTGVRETRNKIAKLDRAKETYYIRNSGSPLNAMYMRKLKRVGEQ